MAATTVGELVLDERVATELREEAQRAGKEPAELANELLKRVLDGRRQYRAALKEGLAAHEAGQYVAGEDVDAWLDTWGEEGDEDDVG